MDAALALLRARVGEPGADRPSIVAGHSEGAVVASMGAERGVRPTGSFSCRGRRSGSWGCCASSFPFRPTPRPKPTPRTTGWWRRSVRAGRSRARSGRPDAPVARLRRTGGGRRSALHGADRRGGSGRHVKRVMQPVLLVQGGRDSSVPAVHADRLETAQPRGCRPRSLSSRSSAHLQGRAGGDGPDGRLHARYGQRPCGRSFDRRLDPADVPLAAHPAVGS